MKVFVVLCCLVGAALAQGAGPKVTDKVSIKAVIKLFKEYFGNGIIEESDNAEFSFVCDFSEGFAVS